MYIYVGSYMQGHICGVKNDQAMEAAVDSEKRGSDSSMLARFAAHTRSFLPVSTRRTW
jgi:hypothetical protein